ncbi:MAG: hypothetical protein ACTTJ2_00895 [Anaerovoracaceae bacterium]
MKNIPDISGMKMSAAARILDAAGICYNTEITEPALPEAHRKKMMTEALERRLYPTERVVRVRVKDDGTLMLTVCIINEPQTAEVAD